MGWWSGLLMRRELVTFRFQHLPGQLQPTNIFRAYYFPMISDPRATKAQQRPILFHSTSSSREEHDCGGDGVEYFVLESAACDVLSVANRPRPSTSFVAHIQAFRRISNLISWRNRTRSSIHLGVLEMTATGMHGRETSRFPRRPR